jgi:hypothetical protein
MPLLSFPIKYPLLYLLLSYWLLSCQSNSVSQQSAPPIFRNAQLLDSLTTRFLLHTHDSAVTWSDTLVSQLIHALQGQQVDTILYYRSGCAGCGMRVKKGVANCACNLSELQSYLYWQYHGRTFVKKIDCCRNHPALATSSAAFAFYYQHQHVLEEGRKFFRDFERYNQAHPAKPRFLPSGPVHDLAVSEMHVRIGGQRQDIQVQSGGYDSLGTPLFLNYAWRRTQWQWAKLLGRLPTEVPKAK